MKAMRFARGRLALAALALLAAAPAGAQEALPPAQQVIDRYVQAIGGREKALSFQSRTLTYRMDVGGTAISMVVKMRRPNLGIMSMTVPPMTEIQSGTDGQVVWSISPAGAELLEGAQAEEVRIRTAFDADVLFDIYPTMETVERAEHGGRPCWKVRMATAGGTELFRCFDVETGLMIATTATQMGMEITAVFDEYKEFDGLKYPARSTASVGGQQVVNTLVNVSHADIPASEFAVPAAVRP
ncbi:MAG TPA: hypothetical protein VFQ45_12035 [Longimicrobium sp.]|nr:hypothetical protein [Longimicrobium sp.]